MYRGPSKRLTAYFSSEMMEARRQWDDILKMPKEKRLSMKNSISNNIIIKKCRRN